MPSISSKKQLLIDHDIPLARNVLNKLPDFAALDVPRNEIWHILDIIFLPIHVQSHALQQFNNFSGMQ